MTGVERVASVDDPRLADYRAIRDGRLRERGGFAAESREVVRRLVRERRFRLRSLLLTEPSLEALRGVLDEATPVYVASHDVIHGVVGVKFHGGCIGIGERGQALTLDDLLARAPRRVVVCERVSNPDNVGGIFRNAMAFGADAVVLSPGSADPLYRKALRVSLGGALAVPFAEVVEWPGAVRTLHEAGLTVSALVTREGADVGSWRPPPRSALLLGAEGDGLDAATLALADERVTIPTAPDVDSLNVAVACGIALHRMWRTA